MSNDAYISFCAQCHEKCHSGTLDQLGTHQSSTGLKHKAIKQNKCQDKCTAFIGKIEKVSEPLQQLQKQINGIVDKVIHSLGGLRRLLLTGISAHLQEYYKSKQSNDIKKYIEHIKNNRYKSISCTELDETLDLIDIIVKDKLFQQKELQKTQKTVSILRQQFNLEFKKIFHQDKALEALMFSQAVDFLSSINQSSIRAVDSSDSHSFKDILSSGLSLNLKNQSKPGKRQFVLAKDLFKEQSDKDLFKEQSVKLQEESKNESNIYTQNKKGTKANDILKSFLIGSDTSSSFKKKQSHHEGSLSSSSSMSNSQSIVSVKSNQQNMVSKPQSSDSKLSSLLLSGQTDSISSSEQSEQSWDSSDDNTDKLNQTLQEIHLQIMNKKQPKSESQFKGYYTIEELEKKDDTELTFSVRVQIVKILYYSVINKHIPKIKFVAGDSTGYGIFFTNFCPGMKVGTILDMYNCQFHLYKGSLEIKNNKSFRILKNNRINIKCNLKGARLNKIMGSDMFYPLMDVRCALARQVGQKLLMKKKIKVRRMYVQIVTILEDDSKRVFCIVGDSSGQMLAYLNKSTLKHIKEGDVVRLIGVMGVRGKHKVGEHSGQILYIDAQMQKSKVLPHGFQFLQISNDIVTL